MIYKFIKTLNVGQQLYLKIIFMAKNVAPHYHYAA